jgi:hypothetical protein
MEQLKGGKEPLMMSGPKFGEKEGWWSRFAKWMGRNRSNLILSVIGILIIIGGIYLYSNYQKSNQPGNPEQQTQQNDQGAVKPEQVNIGGQTNQTSQNQPASAAAGAVSIAEIVNYQNGTYTVKANRGAGVTHLARAAAKQYLEAHQDVKKIVTPEHKIYIEDYLVKHTSTAALAVGQQMQFSDDLIKQAIDSSQKLNQNQLKNLHKYVLLVPSLSG